MPTLVEVLSAEFFPDDLESLSFADLRGLRATFQEFEVDQSYLRRLVQGYLDIVRAEQAGRTGGQAMTVSDLVHALPTILSGGIRGSGPARLPASIDPRTDSELTSELDALVGGDRLARLEELSNASLDQLSSELAEFESLVSGRRRALFERIDKIQAEMTRRYRTGEADIDELLPPEGM